MAGDISDEFQRELVDLFVQQAHESLQNIHVALDELQQSPRPDRHAALISILTAGVTNLASSASVINLPDVEQASLAAIPLIEALTDPHRSFSVQEFLSLCKQLGQIHAALTRTTGVSFEAQEEAGIVTSQTTVSPTDFLGALKTIRARQEEPGPSDRGVIGGMIDQMENQVKAGVHKIPVEVIQGYLDRMTEAEDVFVRSVNMSLSNVSEALSSFGESPDPPTEMLESCLKDVSQLRAEAQHVNAVHAMTFLTGLHSFLSVLVRHRLRLADLRLQAVVMRMKEMSNMVQQWGQQGRAERAAIAQALSASR
jgi:hypothetical protein